MTYHGQYPARVQCGGRVYRAHTPEELVKIVRLLVEGRMDDAAQVFDVVQMPRWLERLTRPAPEGP